MHDTAKRNNGKMAFFVRPDTMTRAALLPILLFLAACDQQAAAPADGNTMSCQTGDLKLSGTGAPDVGVAAFGIEGDTINGFGLSLNVGHAGKVHEVSSSLMHLPMRTGAYEFETLPFYNTRTTERDLLKGYNAGTYSQQFSPVENDPEAKLKVQIDKMVVSDAPQPGFKKIHAVGHFEFNAAALPASSPSDACVSNGIARSLESVKAGKRLLPLFDATVCGAEKKHIRCDFDVIAELAKLQ
ncbi:hypothetical protein GM658_04750 [Pseudoduganella eburnea]|uniref:Lipoprotein n=1 Tax=Massilia eburnea TaxID=1776165 RepID=A0A6L6QCT9_9BURK|nr:hypothetical protein [Massilia eburnea]MTW09901.1 hypothetical protein [Massilia eburnea]